MKDLLSLSPMKILDQSSRGELGSGNLGVFIARAGVGKTACLLHIALEKILRGEGIVHVSLEEGPEKVGSYYNAMYYELTKAADLEVEADYRDVIKKNRMILAYLGKSFQIKRLRENMTTMAENLLYAPKAIVMDGVDFENAGHSFFEGLKEIAREFQVEIWLSALSHRHITIRNEKGIPYPCNELDDLFSIIIQLQPQPSGILLKLLKDHDNPSIPDISLMLDPKTLLVREKR